MIDSKNSQLQKYVTNEVLYHDLFYMFNIFFGEERGNNLLRNYMSKNHLKYVENGWAPSSLIIYSEKLLAGAIGPISTKMIIGNISKHKPVSMTEVLDILKENQQTLQLNKELKKKSNELKKATDDLRNANNKLKLIDEQKDEFLYTVTHELRTPLTSIRALSEVLFDNPDLEEAEREKYLGVVIKETERMTHLITQVLNLEKYESGKQKLNLSTVDFRDIINDVVPTFDVVLKNNNIDFNTIIPNNMMVVRIDKVLIEQVLYNLLSNAIKYTSSSITLAVVENDNELIISILDNGQGIDDSQKALVFDKFYQIKNKKLQKPDGSGLGLAISKNIVEMHNNQLWIENNHPSGAIFSFNLSLI
jgi:signal transduction histidine kinase